MYRSVMAWHDMYVMYYIRVRFHASFVIDMSLIPFYIVHYIYIYAKYMNMFVSLPAFWSTMPSMIVTLTIEQQNSMVLPLSRQHKTS